MADHDEIQPGDNLTNITLTDAELIHLDGRVGDKVQVAVEAARGRIALREARPDLAPRAAGLIADVVREANANGEVVMWSRRMRHCPICNRYAGYAKFKSGMRRGESDPKRPLVYQGWEFAPRFVTVDLRVTLGGCKDCVDPLLPDIAEALRGVVAEVAPRLRAEGEPVRIKQDRRRCTACGWHGHEGEMGRKRTMMGDGTYPATCPSCGAENNPFGRTVIEREDGFVIVGEDGEPCGQPSIGPALFGSSEPQVTESGDGRP